jgi:hypothetical protein
MIDIIRGKIPKRFKTADLKKRQVPGKIDHFKIGEKEYKKNAINTIPSNHSISKDGTKKGDYVKKGRQPAFYRLGKGEYELITDQSYEVVLPNELDFFDDNEGQNESLIISKNRNIGMNPLEVGVPENSRIPNIQLDPVEIIVQTIADKPYRRYFQKQRIWHPTKVANGWGERLLAYFWPTIQDDWPTNSKRIAGFSESAAIIFGNTWNKNNPPCQNALMELFSDICAWGNVKLPEANAKELAFEVDDTVKLIKNEHIPVNARLNSAWTKLYAVILTDHFVMNDSRVGTSINWILDPYMTDLIRNPGFAEYADLGHFKSAGRGGTRPRNLQYNWPSGYGKWSAQFAANRLCRAIRDKLNTLFECRYRKVNDSSKWKLREVEAVLFMDGY